MRLRVASFNNGHVDVQWKPARHGPQDSTMSAWDATVAKSLDHHLELGPLQCLNCHMIIIGAMFRVSYVPWMGFGAVP